jgi:hypothetical protein
MPVGCALPSYALGRDADRIVVVEALEDGVSLGKDADGVEHESSRVRVIAGLKGVSPWPIDSMQSVLSSGSPFDDKIRKPAHLVKTQHYFLLLGHDDDVDQDRISFKNCGVVGEDAASDQEIRRGVAMDDRLKGFEPTFSLEGFGRHRPEPRDR